MISQSDKKAYAEIYYIIQNMNHEYIERVPNKLMNFFEEVRDQNYNVEIDRSIPLYQNNFEEYTFELINLINLNYWCEDEQKKEQLKKMLAESDTEFKVTEHYEDSSDKTESTKDEEKPKKIGFFKRIFK